MFSWEQVSARLSTAAVWSTEIGAEAEDALIHTHTHAGRQAPEWNRKHMAISINPFVLGHGCCRQRQGRQSVDAGNYSRKQQLELVHSGRRTKVVLTIS